MTEIELIIDLHLKNKRQGPGSEWETLKALNLIEIDKNAHLEVADIGCGTGGQTITLAQNLEGHIIAVDLFPELLHELNNKSNHLFPSNRISTLECSMSNLPFEKEQFDIIWSEGAIYNMGFRAGIENWKEYLKPGGYLAVSEATWLTDSRPHEIEEFWNHEYPEIDTASNKVKILEGNGFTLIDYFFLHHDSWIKNYYEPLENGFKEFLMRHEYSEMANSVVKEHQEESALYQKYKAYYSYGFYVAIKK